MVLREFSDTREKRKEAQTVADEFRNLGSTCVADERSLAISKTLPLLHLLGSGIQNYIAFRVADEDTLKCTGWKQAVLTGIGNLPQSIQRNYEGQLLYEMCPDEDVLGRQNGK